MHQRSPQWIMLVWIPRCPYQEIVMLAMLVLVLVLVRVLVRTRVPVPVRVRVRVRVWVALALSHKGMKVIPGVPCAPA